jgi:hypothetical protein
MAVWGHKYLPDSTLTGLAKVLEEGGPELWEEFMAELRETHLGASNANKTVRRPTKSRRISAMQKLQVAYEPALAKRKPSRPRPTPRVAMGQS